MIESRLVRPAPAPGGGFVAIACRERRRLIERGREAARTALLHRRRHVVAPRLMPRQHGDDLRRVQPCPGRVGIAELVGEDQADERAEPGGIDQRLRTIAVHRAIPAIQERQRLFPQRRRRAGRQQQRSSARALSESASICMVVI